MKVEFQYQRQIGTIQYASDGKIKVELENQPELTDQIMQFFKQKFTVVAKFNNPGIPGQMKVTRHIDCVNDFKIALSNIEEEIDIWIHSPQEHSTKMDGSFRSMTEIPWFGTNGFNLVKWNGNDAYPWWVVEDLATGLQAFFEPTVYKSSQLEWFRKSITASGLVDHWREFGEDFRRLEDIPFL